MELVVLKPGSQIIAATARTDPTAGGEFAEGNRVVFCEFGEANCAAARGKTVEA